MIQLFNSLYNYCIYMQSIYIYIYIDLIITICIWVSFRVTAAVSHLRSNANLGFICKIVKL